MICEYILNQFYYKSDIIDTVTHKIKDPDALIETQLQKFNNKNKYPKTIKKIQLELPKNDIIISCIGYLNNTSNKYTKKIIDKKIRLLSDTFSSYFKIFKNENKRIFRLKNTIQTGGTNPIDNIDTIDTIVKNFYKKIGKNFSFQKNFLETINTIKNHLDTQDTIELKIIRIIYILSFIHIGYITNRDKGDIITRGGFSADIINKVSDGEYERSTIFGGTDEKIITKEAVMMFLIATTLERMTRGHTTGQDRRHVQIVKGGTPSQAPPAPASEPPPGPPPASVTDTPPSPVPSTDTPPGPPPASETETSATAMASVEQVLQEANKMLVLKKIEIKLEKNNILTEDLSDVIGVKIYPPDFKTTNNENMFKYQILNDIINILTVKYKFNKKTNKIYIDKKPYFINPLKIGPLLFEMHVFKSDYNEKNKYPTGIDKNYLRKNIENLNNIIGKPSDTKHSDTTPSNTNPSINSLSYDLNDIRYSHSQFRSGKSDKYITNYYNGNIKQFIKFKKEYEEESQILHDYLTKILNNYNLLSITRTPLDKDTYDSQLANLKHNVLYDFSVFKNFLDQSQYRDFMENISEEAIKITMNNYYKQYENNEPPDTHMGKTIFDVKEEFKILTIVNRALVYKNETDNKEVPIRPTQSNLSASVKNLVTKNTADYKGTLSDSIDKFYRDKQIKDYKFITQGGSGSGKSFAISNILQKIIGIERVEELDKKLQKLVLMNRISATQELLSMFINAHTPNNNDSSRCLTSIKKLPNSKFIQFEVKGLESRRILTKYKTKIDGGYELINSTKSTDLSAWVNSGEGNYPFHAFVHSKQNDLTNAINKFIIAVLIHNNWTGVGVNERLAQIGIRDLNSIIENTTINSIDDIKPLIDKLNNKVNENTNFIKINQQLDQKITELREISFYGSKYNAIYKKKNKMGTPNVGGADADDNKITLKKKIYTHTITTAFNIEINFSIGPILDITELKESYRNTDNTITLDDITRTKLSNATETGFLSTMKEFILKNFTIKFKNTKNKIYYKTVQDEDTPTDITGYKFYNTQDAGAVGLTQLTDEDLKNKDFLDFHKSKIIFNPLSLKNNNYLLDNINHTYFNKYVDYVENIIQQIKDNLLDKGKEYELIKELMEKDTDIIFNEEKLKDQLKLKPGITTKTLLKLVVFSMDLYDIRVKELCKFFTIDDAKGVLDSETFDMIDIYGFEEKMSTTATDKVDTTSFVINIVNDIVMKVFLNSLHKGLIDKRDTLVKKIKDAVDKDEQNTLIKKTNKSIDDCQKLLDFISKMINISMNYPLSNFNHSDNKAVNCIIQKYKDLDTEKKWKTKEDTLTINHEVDDIVVFHSILKYIFYKKDIYADVEMYQIDTRDVQNISEYKIEDIFKSSSQPFTDKDRISLSCDFTKTRTQNILLKTIQDIQQMIKERNNLEGYIFIKCIKAITILNNVSNLNIPQTKTDDPPYKEYDSPVVKNQIKNLGLHIISELEPKREYTLFKQTKTINEREIIKLIDFVKTRFFELRKQDLFDTKPFETFHKKHIININKINALKYTVSKPDKKFINIDGTQYINLKVYAEGKSSFTIKQFLENIFSLYEIIPNKGNINKFLYRK
jgi:hypothetical protein